MRESDRLDRTIARLEWQWRYRHWITVVMKGSVNPAYWLI